MQWSKQQEAIFDFFRNGQGNLVVVARAGSGKTTTMIEGVSHAPERRILMAAFNKKIAVELDSRLSHPGAVAKTLHSLGFGFVRRYWEDVKIDSRKNRAWTIAREVGRGAPDEVLKEAIELSTKLKAVAPMIGSKHAGPDIAPEEIEEAITIADQFGIFLAPEWEARGFDVEKLALFAIRILCMGAEFRDGQIDFDDMIWLPVRNCWVSPTYDLVVIDECQDMNRAQIDLALSACRSNGRIVAVGDDRQAIYGFRGADSGSLGRLQAFLNATELGLTTTYRCGKTIVREAQAIVPDFVAGEKNPPGVIQRSSVQEMLHDCSVGDFILSRTNAPLVPACLSLIRMGKRARVEGRDIGQGLKALVRKCSKNTRGWSAFRVRLGEWFQSEMRKARARGERADAALQRLRDQELTLSYLMEGLSSVKELTARIEELFTDTEGSRNSYTVLSTVHKSKGLESSRVWILDDTFKLNFDPQEEANIRYVAITRAKDELVYVYGSLEE